MSAAAFPIAATGSRFSRLRDSWLPAFVFGLTLLTVVLAVPFPVEARKLFFLTGGLAAIAWVSSRQRPDGRVVIVLAVIALFALYRAGHTWLDAGAWHPDIDAWQVYLATASRLLTGVFLIGYLVSCRRPFATRWLSAALCAALVLSAVSACWQELVLGQGRGDREQRATLFSYEIVAVYFAYLGLQLMHTQGSRWRWLLLSGVSVLALWLVLWTETRSALAGFFIGGVLLVVLSDRVRKWRVLGGALALGALVLALGYSDFIRPRLLEAQSDLTQYFSGEKRDTSIGTRLELWKGSMMAFAQAPWLGGGYRQRADVIREAVDQGRLDPVAVAYSSVTMHNELLEEFSLRGIAGGALLLALYGALAGIALARGAPRDLALLGLVFAYAFFGLTDVLFFSREATIVFVVLAALLIPASVQRNENNDGKQS